MIISFQKTVQPFRELNKCVTRRLWKPKTAAHFRTGKVYQAWTATPYVKNAAPLGTIRAIKNAYTEPLEEITWRELHAEGDLWHSRAEFLAEFGKPPFPEVTVARFVIESLFDERTNSQVPARITTIYVRRVVENLQSLSGFGFNLSDADKTWIEIIEKQRRSNEKLFGEETTKLFNPGAVNCSDVTISRRLFLWCRDVQLRAFGFPCWLKQAAANQGFLSEAEAKARDLF